MWVSLFYENRRANGGCIYVARVLMQPHFHLEFTEKEELVNLVLIHANNYSPDSQSSGRNQRGSNDDRSNPFDQLKNTCQNIFSSFTEKLAAGE